MAYLEHDHFGVTHFEDHTERELVQHLMAIRAFAFRVGRIAAELFQAGLPCRVEALGPRWFDPVSPRASAARLPNTPRHPGRTGAYACPARVPWKNSEAVVPLLYNDFRYSTKSNFCWLLKPRLNLLS